MAPPLRNIDQLNDDILLRIFDYLDFDDKIRLRRTCSRWRQLINSQLRRVKALRLGQFHLGGYQVTSGLSLKCCEHHGASKASHRRQTGSLFNERLLEMPADFETQCYSIKRFDLLHKSLREAHQSITMLSLGRIQISYRLLVALTSNLPKLEHLELINCASQFHDNQRQQRLNTDWQQQQQRRLSRQEDENLPSLESFNNEHSATMDQVKRSIMTNVIYNQHQDEQVNVRERLIRSTFVKNCNLVREAKRTKLWPNMRHLLVKECNLMNEFTLSLILALTSQSLIHLEIDKNQYLTGEFLNYCGPQLEVVRIRHCPSMRESFVNDLVKIRKLLGSNIKFNTCHGNANDLDAHESSSSSLKLTTSVSSAALLAILFSA